MSEVSLNVIVTAALVSGATAIAKSLATDAVRSLYRSLKRLLGGRVDRAVLQAVDKDPLDTVAQTGLLESLDVVEFDAVEREELLRTAKELMIAAAREREVGEVVVNLRRSTQGSLSIRDLVGDVVRIDASDSVTTRDVEVSQISADRRHRPGKA